MEVVTEEILPQGQEEQAKVQVELVQDVEPVFFVGVNALLPLVLAFVQIVEEPVVVA